MLSADERKIDLNKNRQEEILRIISEECITTQTELLDRLNERGYQTTQATVSRDIKALRLIKKPDELGRSHYVADSGGKDEIFSKYNSVFGHSVISLDYAGNIVCVKCYNGMANAACATLDAMELEGAVGTIAGDDTIFVLCRSEEAAVSLINTMQEALKG